MHRISDLIIIGWIIFWLYWFIMAFGSKKNKKTHFRQFIGIRVAIIVTFLLIARPFSSHASSFKNHYLFTNNEVVLMLGFIAFVIGLLLAIWARIYLGKNWGMPMSVKQDPKLVTSGPYRYIRHPIYTGILTAVLGSIMAGGVYWLVMLAFAGPYFIYSAVIEEKLMMKQFPKTYPEYKAKTKLLIPFLL